MTLQDVIRIMEKAASVQPGIAMLVRNDIFRLNGYADARYGVFAWTQQQHQQVSDDLIRYSFSLFYVDRLTADKSNQVAVQSAGIEILGNVIRTMQDAGCYPNQATFTTFNQRFLDECAGVFCNVSFEVPVAAYCPEEYADFNADFNEDFFIL